MNFYGGSVEGIVNFDIDIIDFYGNSSYNFVSYEYRKKI